VTGSATDDSDPRDDWQKLTSGGPSRWVRQLNDPYGGTPFTFFAFRTPALGDTYHVAALYPNLDDEAHSWHMQTVYVCGRRVPVIDPPHLRPLWDLADVLKAAATWVIYALRRLHSRPVVP
jgi:hypothetical protein